LPEQASCLDGQDNKDKPIYDKPIGPKQPSNAAGNNPRNPKGGRFDPELAEFLSNKGFILDGGLVTDELISATVGDSSDDYGSSFFEFKTGKTELQYFEYLGLAAGVNDLAVGSKLLYKGAIKYGPGLYKVYEVEGASGALKYVFKDAKGVFSTVKDFVVTKSKDAYSATKTFVADKVDDVAKKFGGKKFDFNDFFGYNVKVGDVRLNAETSLAAKEFFNDISIYERKSAEVVNRQIEQWYSKPPFAEKTSVSLFKTDTTMQDKFVRMYTHDIDNPNPVLKGQFMALRQDAINVNGNFLSATQLKDKFDLPTIPTHISTVNPPVGTELAVGIVKPENFGGAGGGTQFYFTTSSKKEWFSIGELIQ
jgi:hypothetical protein